MDTAAIGDFQLHRTIGRGRYGVVHRATHVPTGRVVALKVLTDQFADDPLYRARFRRECDLLARLSHPHVIPILEAGEADGSLYLAMQLIHGTTLKELITEGAPALPRAMRILSAVGGALDAAHSVGIIHRDVKPRNVMLGGADHAYLGDFGLARGPGGGTLTGPGEVLGTIDYMPPENLEGEPATVAGDIYALSCMAFELLTGEVPFCADNDAAILYAHVTAAPPSLAARRPELPAELDEVVATGMAKDPADRPPTVRALLTGMWSALGAPARAGLVAAD
jgi:serine/threonine protein kinase